MESNQLGKNIYSAFMYSLKYTLNMEERKYEDGRKDQRFRFYKQELMDKAYKRLEELYALLEEQGLLEKIDGEHLKFGYKETPSGGCGYVNSKQLDEILRLD